MLDAQACHPRRPVLVTMVSRLSNEYDTQQQILDAEGPLTRAIIETVMAQRYERLVADKIAIREWKLRTRSADQDGHQTSGVPAVQPCGSPPPRCYKGKINHESVKILGIKIVDHHRSRQEEHRVDLRHGFG